MSSKMTRAAYETVIAEDLAWLENCGPCLIRDHVIQIVKRSADHEYAAAPPDASERELRLVREAISRSGKDAYDAECVEVVFAEVDRTHPRPPLDPRIMERESICAALRRWAAPQDAARGGALGLAADLIHGDVHHEADSAPAPLPASEPRGELSQTGPWGSLPTDAADPNYGRCCGRCGGAVRAGGRYAHGCPPPAETAVTRIVAELRARSVVLAAEFQDDTNDHGWAISHELDEQADRIEREHGGRP